MEAGCEKLPERNSTSESAKKLCKLIGKSVLIALCFLVYLIGIPVFFVCIAPLYFYRFLVIIAQKVLKPDWVGIMSTRDALVGLDDTSRLCECMITLILVLKGEPDMDVVRKVFHDNVLNGKNSRGELSYLKLQQYFEKWMGFTFWKKEANFQLDTHVRELDARDTEDPNNNSDVVTEEQLMKILGSLATKPFPRGVSPWEALVVKNYLRATPQLHTNVKDNVPNPVVEKGDNKNVECALVLRIHHGIGDGYSIMKLIMSNLCSSPLSDVPTAPVRKVSPLVTLLNFVGIILLTPYFHFLQFFINVDRTVWHLPSRRLKREWQFNMTERMSFARIKDISRNQGVCVTTTLLAGLAGGINAFLKSKGKAGKNTRIMRGLSPMPWKNHPMDTLVNHWTVGIFDIPVNESCARQRLLAAQKTVKMLKRSPILVTNFITVPVLLGVPNFLTDFWGTNWMTTMILSNFPGPSFPTVAFHEQNAVDDVISWVPHMRGSAGIGIMFISFNGGVRVTLSVDKAIMKEQKELEELSYLIGQEFLALGSLPTSAEAVV